MPDFDVWKDFDSVPGLTAEDMQTALLSCIARARANPSLFTSLELVLLKTFEDITRGVGQYGGQNN